MRLLVRGGVLVGGGADARIDVVCRDGRIESWNEPGRVMSRDVDAVFDAAGKLVFPGFIDPHVHSRDPGQTHKETFGNSTRIAATTGITTVFEMPNAVPPVTDGERFRDRVAYLRDRAHVNFGLWGMIVDDPAHLLDLAGAGAIAVKVFWGLAYDHDQERLIYSGSGDQVSPPMSSGDLLRILEVSSEAGIVVGVHCEDRSIIEQRSTLHAAYDDYEGLLATRPAVSEAAAVAVLAELTSAASARSHVLHVSSAQTVEVLRAARARQIDITAETCPHYLMLTSDDFERVGGAIKVYPPIRSPHDRAALWKAIAAGVISSVGSDHAPHSASERDGPLHAQPAGARSLHILVRTLVGGVANGWITPSKLARVMSEDTARRFGIHPRKGSLLPGADADMTIVDPNAPWRLPDPALGDGDRTEPWTHGEGRGLAVATIIAGRIVAQDGNLHREFTGEFVRPTHAVARSRSRRLVNGLEPPEPAGRMPEDGSAAGAHS